MTYYLVIKGNEVLTHVTAWMKLENIMLFKYEMSRIGKSMGAGSRLVIG
jgi:hypothetical protein